MKKRQTFIIEGRNKTLHLGDRTVIMGIINCTPDSFSDGGENIIPETAAGNALKMVKQGADIIDIGGESTRPGAKEVCLEEEIRRIVPVIEKIRERSDVWLSIDTTKSEVAEQAVNAGADIINDISGFRYDPNMISTAQKLNTPVIVMHMQGLPGNMQDNPVYENVIEDIFEFFSERILVLTEAGIKKNNIILDPGIGFGKTLEHNLVILNRLDKFAVLDLPLLIGVSRKSLIGGVLNTPVEERLEGTAASVAFSIERGTHIVRVHDVKEISRVAAMTDAIINETV